MTNALVQNAQSDITGALNNILIVNATKEAKNIETKENDVCNFSNILNNANAKTQKTHPKTRNCALGCAVKTMFRFILFNYAFLGLKLITTS